MRAGCWQVIDVVAIVIENAFRPDNGRTVSSYTSCGDFAGRVCVLCAARTPTLGILLGADDHGIPQGKDYEDGSIPTLKSKG